MSPVTAATWQFHLWSKTPPVASTVHTGTMIRVKKPSASITRAKIFFLIELELFACLSCVSTSNLGMCSAFVSNYFWIIILKPVYVKTGVTLTALDTTHVWELHPPRAPWDARGNDQGGRSQRASLWCHLWVQRAYFSHRGNSAGGFGSYIFFIYLKL